MNQNFAKKILNFCKEEVSKIKGIEAITATGSHVNGNFHKYSDVDIAIIIDEEMHKLRDKVRDYFKKNFEVTFCRWQEDIKQDIIWIYGNYMIDLTYPSVNFLKDQMKNGQYWQERIEKSKVIYDNKKVVEDLLKRIKPIKLSSKLKFAEHTSKEIITVYNSLMCGLTTSRLSLINISIHYFIERILRLLSSINNININPREFENYDLEYAPKNWIKRLHSIYLLSSVEEYSKAPKIAKKIATESFELANMVFKTKKFNKYIKILKDYK